MKYFYRYYFLFLLLLIAHVCSSQAYDFVRYGIEDGLANETITDIDQDIYGNLWIATQGGGVSKYDGLKFTNITVKDGLNSNYVRKLICGQDGSVWLATAKGIAQYKNERLLLMLGGSSPEQESVNAIALDRSGNLWYAVSSNGIFRRGEDGAVEHFDSANGFVDDRVIDIKVDDQGAVWVVTIVNGLYRFVNNLFERVVSTSDLKGYILSLSFDNDEPILATNRGAFLLKDSLQAINGLQGVFIKSIIHKGNDRWNITANSLMKTSGEQLEIYGVSEGYSPVLTNTGFLDREGNLWFGTNGDGLWKFTGFGLNKFDQRHGLLYEDVLSIAKDKAGALWLGTNGGGAFKYEDGAFVNIGTNQGLPNNYITALAKGKNDDLWMGTRGAGVIRYNTKTGQVDSYNTNDGLINNIVRRLYYSEEGDLWVATVNGLSQWDGIRFKNFDTNRDLYDNVIWNISEKNGQVYFVSRQGINVYQDDEMQEFMNDETIFSKRVNTINLEDDSSIFVGYSGHGVNAISRFNNNSKWYTSSEGLTSDIIHDLTKLDDSRWLITSDRGIDLMKLDDDLVQAVRYFGTSSSGLGLAKTNPGALFKDGNKIWIGTKGGVYRYSFVEEHKLEAPIIKMSAVTLLYNEAEYPVVYEENKTTELKYSQNSLAISYFATCINDADNITYQYKLTDFQEEWSLPSRTPYTMFTNLPHGEYLFQVKALNSDKIASKQTAYFRFVITPPIWQRPWFYFLLTLLLVAIVRYIYLYRVQANVERVLEYEKIREEEATKVRKNMARDFHDNMGNQLASITVFSNLISLKLKDKTEEIDDLLQNIEQHSKSLYNGTKDFIWSMNPESDNLQEIFVYIKDFGEDLFGKTEINFYADYELDGKHISVPSGWSRQFVLIFKEAMTNALKYSKASTVHLSLKLEQRSFVISFVDNGVGMKDEDISKGNGYRNMSSRAKQVGCQIEISNQSESGVGVVLSGKLPNKEENQGIKIY